jgi:20S proteasome alpha/beta subunit
VDLNRNWPYRWEKDYDRSNCWHYRPTTAGEYAGSEPETTALIDFIESHPEIDALISYHAAALGIFAGGVPDYQPSIRLAKSFAKVSDYQYPPKDIGCVYTGNFTDWASSVREIAAVDIELHNFRYTDLDENLKILKVFLKFKK